MSATEPIAWIAGTAVGALTLFEWIPVDYSRPSRRMTTVEDVQNPGRKADFYGAIRSAVSWAPPRGVYGPVWFVLYVLMSVAFGYWWLASAGGATDIVLHRAVWITYFVSLLFNKLWTFLFFGLRSRMGLVLAAVDALLILASAIAVVWLFHCDGAPVVTLVLWYIYIAWLAFASALSIAIAAKRDQIFTVYKRI